MKWFNLPRPTKKTEEIGEEVTEEAITEVKIVKANQKRKRIIK